MDGESKEKGVAARRQPKGLESDEPLFIRLPFRRPSRPPLAFGAEKTGESALLCLRCRKRRLKFRRQDDRL